MEIKKVLLFLSFITLLFVNKISLAEDAPKLDPYFLKNDELIKEMHELYEKGKNDDLAYFKDNEREIARRLSQAAFHRQ